jgi:hypothetical protein
VRGMEGRRKEVVAVVVVDECRTCILHEVRRKIMEGLSGYMFGPEFGARTFRLNVRKPVL